MSDIPTIQNKLIALIRKHMRDGYEDMDINSNTVLADLDIESLDVAMVIFDLETDLGIELPFDTSDASTAPKTVGEAVAAIEKQVETQNKVVKVLRENMRDGQDMVISADTLIATLNIDSLDTAMLVFMIEDEFDMLMPEDQQEDISAIKKVGDIVTYMNDVLAKQELQPAA